MIEILKTIGIYLYKAYFFLPNLAVSFCEAHFKGDLGTFMALGVFVVVGCLQATPFWLLFWIVTGELPSMEDEGEDDWDLFGAYTGSCDGYFIVHDILDDDDDC